jgi:heme/copper-type cytochrome/quinol oxidase subunit 4
MRILIIFLIALRILMTVGLAWILSKESRHDPREHFLKWIFILFPIASFVVILIWIIVEELRAHIWRRGQ